MLSQVRRLFKLVRLPHADQPADTDKGPPPIGSSPYRSCQTLRAAYMPLYIVGRCMRHTRGVTVGVGTPTEISQ